MKKKIKIKGPFPISREDFLSTFKGKKLKKMQESMAKMDLSKKHNIDTFSGVAHSVPIPTHLLKSRISKSNEHVIAQMVAHIVNKERGMLARTVEFLDKHPAGTPEGDLVRKGIKWTKKCGKESDEALNELWKKPKGYVVGPYEVSSISRMILDSKKKKSKRK